MLKPETQDMDAYVDGINNITEAQQKVAQQYFDDGSIDDACPPLQVLLHVMAKGSYKGKPIDDPSLREMFTRDYLINSEWYKERLQNKLERDARLWQMNKNYLEQKMDEITEDDTEKWAQLQEDIENAEQMIEWVTSQSYLDRLHGTIGADWVHRDD